MPRIQPTSTITIYSGIQITGGMNIAFSSRAAQQAYFNRHVKLRSVGCTYVRKTGRLKIETTPAIINNCNYISFKNPAFIDREIYARIFDWEYVNNVTLEISYTVDWWQTYLFDCRYLRGSISREHLSQTDFNKAESNPFDLSIYEFNTKEDLPVGPELEPNYTLGQNLDTIGPTGPPLCVMQVSSWDTDIVPLEMLTEYAMEWFTPDNDVFIGGTKMGELKLPHAYYTFVLEMRNMQKLLDVLTKQGLTQEIIGVYMVNSDIIGRYLAINDSIPDRTLYTIPDTAINRNYRNKKLCRHPFQYCRVTSPANATKEYKYERFMSGKKLYMALSLDGVNMISVIPFAYNEFNPSGTIAENLNFLERLDYTNIGQIGYATDAYLAYLSNQYAKTIENRSLSKAAFLGGTVESTYDYAHPTNISASDRSAEPRAMATAAQLAGAMIPEGLSNLPIVSDLTSGTYSFEELAQQDLAQAYRQGDNNVANPYDIYKDAYAADEYHAGDSNGMIDSYFSIDGNKLYQFQVFFVSLLPDIMEKYDHFFSYYGYNSKRVGVPRILNYVTRSGDQPHFDDLDGLEKTYVKTDGLRITNVPESVSGFIEGMFNNGCLFLKGESLS